VDETGAGGSVLRRTDRAGGVQRVHCAARKARTHRGDDVYVLMFTRRRGGDATPVWSGYRLFAEQVRDHAILMVDPGGVVTSWSTAAQRIMGYSATEVIGRPESRLYLPEDEAAGVPQRALALAREHGRHEEEGWRVRKDGSRVRLHVVTTPLHHPSRRVVGYARVIRDLSERVAAEEALRRSEEQLRHAQKMEAVGRLAGGIAHDFNNLITAIRGHAQFILEDLPVEHASRADAEEIKRSADRAASLTRQLLTFSRRQPEQRMRLDVNEVIRGMDTLCRRLIREDIEFSLALGGSSWPVFADRSHIEQVLMNLIVNARDAIPARGRIRIETRNVELDEQYRFAVPNLRPGDYVQIAVSDTGTGMDRETQSRIFEPFFTTKPEGVGTGLGLATVYGIVRQCGGHITVYSEPQRGTTFKILLPRAAQDAEVAEPEAVCEAEPPAEVEPHGATVLIAEDDDSVRSFAARVLKQRGYHVVDASSGDEALDAAERTARRIDLLLTDVNMPSPGGRELAERLRERLPGVRSIFMSGFTQEDVVSSGMIDAGDTFLEKPFSPVDLLEKVRRALD
jgi:two-component system, cell cycle sensor histidine kinase and response regulator CckA